MVFVDTGVWFALLVAKDPNHQRTTEWFVKLSEQIITSDYVVDETLTLLLMRGERKKLLSLETLSSSALLQTSTKLLRTNSIEAGFSFENFRKLD
ncbi:MAG: PIN domain-containing protein [Pirellulaceae bacterium]|nr:PIN domain-containing protein [Pirellulaceae bacterium]